MKEEPNRRTDDALHYQRCQVKGLKERLMRAGKYCEEKVFQLSQNSDFGRTSCVCVPVGNGLPLEHEAVG